MAIEQQKKMVVINDLACYGRCAIAVAQPIISAMGIESCPLPTAMLSTNGAFRGCVINDMADFMGETIKHWNELELSFDGICSGFYTSVQQMEHARHLLANVDREKTLVFMDPIMGDYGKRYSVTKEEVCKGYRSLIRFADVLTPNLTECCELLDIAYPDTVPDQEELVRMAERLALLGPTKIVITGLDRGDAFENFVYEDGAYHSIMANKIGASRCGTGDVFMAVLAGKILSGVSFYEAVNAAVEFLNIAIAKTVEHGISPRNGVCFEECLSVLVNKSN